MASHCLLWEHWWQGLMINFVLLINLHHLCLCDSPTPWIPHGHFLTLNLADCTAYNEDLEQTACVCAHLEMGLQSYNVPSRDMKLHVWVEMTHVLNIGHAALPLYLATTVESRLVKLANILFLAMLMTGLDRIIDVICWVLICLRPPVGLWGLSLNLVAGSKLPLVALACADYLVGHYWCNDRYVVINMFAL